MKNKDTNWDYNQWQGRSRKQVEGNYIILSIAMIGLIALLAVAAVL